MNNPVSERKVFKIRYKIVLLPQILKACIMEKFDWKNLPFGYIKTDYNVRCIYKNGKWGKLEVSSSEYIDIHIAATALHYG